VNAISVIVFVTLTMFACGFLAAFLAHNKNRDVSYWAAWGFLFPPSVVLLFVLGTNQGPRPRRPSLDEEDRMHL
jgi:hypothetical protein